MLKRFRIWLATRLCRGTACVVARRGAVARLESLGCEIADYVERSGALNDPSRIRAYRVLLRAASELSATATSVKAADFDTFREEEGDASKQTDEAAAA